MWSVIREGIGGPNFLVGGGGGVISNRRERFKLLSLLGEARLHIPPLMEHSGLQKTKILRTVHGLVTAMFLKRVSESKSFKPSDL